MMGWGNMIGGYGMGYYGNYGAGNFWWMGLIGMALHFVFWIAVIAIVWHLISRFGFNTLKGNARDDNALGILRERFAKGEIDFEEYTQRKEKLVP